MSVFLVSNKTIKLYSRGHNYDTTTTRTGALSILAWGIIAIGAPPRFGKAPKSTVYFRLWTGNRAAMVTRSFQGIFDCNKSHLLIKALLFGTLYIY